MIVFTEPAEIINALRSVGWTRLSIARQLGVSHSTIVRIVQGYQRPSISLYRKLVELVQAEAKRAEAAKAAVASLRDTAS